MASYVTNADISNNPSTLTTTAPASPPNYESTHQSRQPASSVEGIKHIWFITGPAGCGKTTIAQAVSSQLHMHYLEGDDFHSQANISKMAAGTPLTDEDRWDWLLTLRQASINELSAPSPSPSTPALRGVVATCSALKKSYRDVLRGHPAPISPDPHSDPVVTDMPQKLDEHWNEDVTAGETRHIKTHFLYLSAPEGVLVQRVGGRQGHYMGVNMVHSQLEILEEPREGEEDDCLRVDVSPPAEEVKERVVRIIGEKMDEL